MTDDDATAHLSQQILDEEDLAALDALSDAAHTFPGNDEELLKVGVSPARFEQLKRRIVAAMAGDRPASMGCKARYDCYHDCYHDKPNEQSWPKLDVHDAVELPAVRRRPFPGGVGSAMSQSAAADAIRRAGDQIAAEWSKRIDDVNQIAHQGEKTIRYMLAYGGTYVDIRAAVGQIMNDHSVQLSQAQRDLILERCGRVYAQLINKETKMGTTDDNFTINASTRTVHGYTDMYGNFYPYTSGAGTVTTFPSQENQIDSDADHDGMGPFCPVPYGAMFALYQTEGVAKRIELPVLAIDNYGCAQVMDEKRGASVDADEYRIVRGEQTFVFDRIEHRNPNAR